MSSTPITRVIIASSIGAILVIAGCRRLLAHAPPPQDEAGPAPSASVSLKALGLPEGFFQHPSDARCSREIIVYRFVVWLDTEHVAVGFSTSPNCRLAPDIPVQGNLRILVFNSSGVATASRDMSYRADGNGELVADGEATAGPEGTLLIRFQSVNLDKEGRQESPSSVSLLDASLKDVARVDRFLEQTTLVKRALVFQDGFVIRGPRNYSIMSGSGLTHVEKRQVDWPEGTRTHKFGEHEVAFIHCEQEVSPGQYRSTDVVLAGAKVRCSLNVLGEKDAFWTRQLADGQGANVIGVLSDGSVVGETYENGGNGLVIWRKGKDPEPLPWIPSWLDGQISSTTPDFSRYAVFATSDAGRCNALARVLKDCNDSGDGRWYVFDRKSAHPIVSRVFPGNGRAAMSPDGKRYATFEAGELRIFTLP